MTWIEDTKRSIAKNYNITPRVVENDRTRYGYHHRAVFFKEYDSRRRNRWSVLYALSRMIRDRDGFDEFARTRVEYDSVYVYFSDLDRFLSSLDQDVLRQITKLELTDPAAISAINKYTHEYPVSLTVKRKLPHGKYRYRIHVNTSHKTRKMIGEDTLRHVKETLKTYGGVRMPWSFEAHASRINTYSTLYFYAEDLEWLPMIYLMVPNYIKKIEHFKTTEEINNEQATDQDSTRT